MILVHNYDSYTGSARAAAQIIENTRTDIVIYGKSEAGGFISDILESKSDVRSFAIHVQSSKSIIGFIKIQLITFLILLQVKGYKQKLFINALLPFSTILYSIILYKTDSIIWVHEQKLMNPILNIISRFLMRLYTKRILYCSEFLKSIYCVNGDVLSPYVDEVYFESFKKRTAIHKVLMLSSLSEYKGIDMFIKLSGLYCGHPGKIQFTLVLSCDSNQGTYYFDKKSYSVPSTIKIVYSPSNVLDYYRDADLLVNLTNRDCIIESFGLTIAEALTNGIPVLCPGIGGPKELLGMNNEYGMLMDERSLDEVKIKLDLLIENQELYQAMSRNIYGYRNRFSKQNFLYKLNELL